MQFLSPWSALIAAAVALPLLLLLYFLKLRRQTLRIPSTLLWQRSFEDLQVNVPFQRLRWSALLALQLMMLAALLLALSEPMWRSGPDSSAARIVLLIDRSASMNAPVSPTTTADDDDDEPRPSRLDAAKAAAIDVINTLGERSGPTQIMVIAFGASATVVSTYERNRGVLRDAVNSISPTDEQSNLATALELASAFAGTGVRDESINSDLTPMVMLLSDGNVAAANDRASFSLRAGEFRFMQVAGTADTSSEPSFENIGIVGLGARRDFDDPARVIVFTRLVNAGRSAVETVVTVNVDLTPAASIRISIPPRSDDGTPGEQSLTHALDLPGGTVITLRHNRPDHLPADDVAAIVVPPPAQPRIAFVHPSDSRADPYLYELLQAMEPQSIQLFTAEAWSQTNPIADDGRPRFDLVIFDRISGQRLPGVASITFGGVPAGLTAIQAPDDRGQPILSWDRQHPVMRNLALDAIIFSGFGSLELPEIGATALAWGTSGPIIAMVRTRGARHVVVGFVPARSNWPLHVSSAMFMQNAVEFLTLAGESAGSAAGGNAGVAYRAGEPITLRASPQAQAITITGEDGTRSIPVGARAGTSSTSTGSTISAPLITVPGIARAGLYAVSGALPPHEQALAVNVLSDVESDIRPRATIVVNAQAAAAHSQGSQQPMPLWPWLLAIALVLAVIEWLVYCRRVG